MHAFLFSLSEEKVSSRRIASEDSCFTVVLKLTSVPNLHSKGVKPLISSPLNWDSHLLHPAPSPIKTTLTGDTAFNFTSAVSKQSPAVLAEVRFKLPLSKTLTGKTISFTICLYSKLGVSKPFPEK